MAVHKVPQDVEAEDKFLGPLTFKQFLFFGGFAIFGYVTFLSATRVWPLAPVFALPAVVFGILAVPWSKDQPTEVFLGARFRFLFKPRKRIWDQTGIKQLVHITVPKREAHIYSDGLSQNEVRKRFGALATMVDSRGWAIKTVPGLSQINIAQDEESDRLVAAPLQAPSTNEAILQATPDVLDEDSGSVGKSFDTMIAQAEQRHKNDTQRMIQEARSQGSGGGSSGPAPDPQKRPDDNGSNQSQTNNSTQALIQQARSQGGGTNGTNQQQVAQDPQDFWFMHQKQGQGQGQPAPDPNLATFGSSTVVSPGSTSSTTTATSDIPEESQEEVLRKIHEKERRDALQTHSHHGKVIDPNGPEKQAEEKGQKNQNPSVTTPVDPAILNLASNRDLNVATIERQANKKDDDQDEVVISLH